MKIDYKLVNNVALICGGVLLGLYWKNRTIEDSNKSRAEIDRPEDVEAACYEMEDLLSDWNLNENYISEDDFTRDLVGNLEKTLNGELIYIRRPLNVYQIF